jgi:site-specific recombinase XerD
MAASYRREVKSLKNKDLAFFVTRFFTHYLTTQRNVSENTVKAYRDAFLLLLAFVSEHRGISMEKLEVAHIDKDVVSLFLDWLEQTRKNSITTRNQRLAAIHAFFKYIQAENIEFMFHSKQLLSIPFKRHPKPLVQHLEETELKAIFQMPDVSTTWGRRDLTLLCVLYDTGGRVQEIIDLTVSDVRFEIPAVIKLTGKGNKTRAIPLMHRTAALLKDYFDEQKLMGNAPTNLVFFNKQGQKLTRKGVAYILDKYAKQAAEQTLMPSFNITPHVFRHTKAMHLLRADVNMFYIRDILGHVDISTTEVYARVDAEKKRAVLEKISINILPENRPQWQTDENLMTWLKNLGK